MSATDLTAIQYRLKQRLRNGDIESVLRELDTLLQPNVRAFNDLVQLQSRYQDARREYYVKGILKYKNEFENTTNHIREGLLLVIDALKPEDLRAPEEFDPLLQELRQLRVDSDKARLPVSLVNCNRATASKTYRACKRLQLDKIFQGFLVQACPLQMPHSFTERLIWEDVQRLDADPDAQFYIKQNAPDSLEIPALNLIDQDPESTLDEFKLEFHSRHNQFFAGKFSHAAFGYALHEKNWDDSAPESIGAIANWLQSLTGSGRRLFAFFLVVYIENLHQPEKLQARQRAICEALAGLCQDQRLSELGLRWPDAQPGPGAEPEALLHPVPRDEIEKWLHRIALYGHADNAAAILDRFDAFVRQQAPERYRADGIYAMRDVQELQKMLRTVALEHT